ncbi:MAG: sigma 54-interacting transcriptional regulator [Planctomycetota bacterium]|nr:sigma 54-interacting transcriptional regulator [Planctomycetota bacterium]
MNQDKSLPLAQGGAELLEGFRKLGAARDLASALDIAADLVLAGVAPSWVVISVSPGKGETTEVVRGITLDPALTRYVRSLGDLPQEGIEIPPSALPDLAGSNSALAFPLVPHARARGALVVGFTDDAQFRRVDRDFLAFLGRQVDLTTRQMSGADSFLRDSHTGLRTHVGFLLRLLDEWSACEAKGSPISVVMIEVGTSIAGIAGTPSEGAMRRAAELLREETGEVDLLGRRGPSTLEILLPQVGAEWAHRIARRIAKRIGKESLRPPSAAEGSLTCRTEVATGPEEASSPESLLERVEEKMRDTGDPADPATPEELPWDEQGKALLGMVSRVLEAGWDLEALLDILVAMLVEIMDAERGFVLMRDTDGSLMVRSARGRGNVEVESPEKEVSRKIANRVLKTGQPIRIHDAGTDPLFADSESVAGLGLRAVLCAPIQLEGAPFGCIYLEHRLDPGRFSASDEVLLVEFARRVSRHLSNSLEFRRRSQDIEKAAQRLAGYVGSEEVPGEAFGIIGRSPGLLRTLELLRKAIPSQLPVHVSGESGTGKELIARAIHFEGPRKSGPFISENCAAIPESIFERELFGHVRGVFTGATSEKPGLIEAAAGGTLFLDEIGELSLGMQAKLLRALEEKGIRRLGGQEWIQIDFRLVTASNRSLEDLVQEGKFRQDLYYRLEGVTISLPPLRDRKEDIPLLVEAFLQREAEEEGSPVREFPRDVLMALLRHDWPGNVRELENTIRRACAVGGAEITIEDLPRRLREETTFRRYLAPKRTAGPEADGDGLTRAIEQAGGNKTEAARRLGISKSTLYARLKRLRERRGPQKP